MDWPSFTLGLLIGMIATVAWWANSRVRAWWQHFEQSRLRIEADNARLQRRLRDLD
jgi:hypothetical protein